MKLILAISSLAMIGMASCNTAKSPSQLLDKASSEMVKGYEELDKVDEKFFADKEKSAKKHLNKAMKHFDNAVVYLAQAELSDDDKPAVSELKSGLDSLEKCVKALEADDLETAQKLYAEAQQHFDEARSLLNRT